MTKLLDISGQRYGMLIATHRGPNSRHMTRWFCRCDCGKETLVFLSAIRSGITKSCGCLRGESHKEANYSEKKKPASKEYRAWCEMKKRCYNPRVKAFKYYGGRGITMCDAWRESFAAFLRDVGRAPDPSMSIDRYPDKDGHYEPGNVRWATHSQQSKNRRQWKRGPSRTARVSPCRSLEIQGRPMTIAEIANRAGVRPAVIYKRITLGWPIEELCEPALPKGMRRLTFSAHLS